MPKESRHVALCYETTTKVKNFRNSFDNGRPSVATRRTSRPLPTPTGRAFHRAGVPSRGRRPKVRPPAEEYARAAKEYARSRPLQKPGALKQRSASGQRAQAAKPPRDSAAITSRATPLPSRLTRRPE